MITLTTTVEQDLLIASFTPSDNFPEGDIFQGGGEITEKCSPPVAVGLDTGAGGGDKASKWKIIYLKIDPKFLVPGWKLGEVFCFSFFC